MAIKFGTSGWRAVISEEFTFPNLRKVAYGVAGHVRDNPDFGFHSPDYLELFKGESAPLIPSVVVGCDTRYLSEEFARETAEVLAANGVKTYLSKEEVPTPVVAWAIRERRAVGGVTITASHNPPDYNGFKWSPFWGGPATPEITSDIERRLGFDHAVKSYPLERALREGMVEQVEFRTGYLKALGGLLDAKLLRRSGLKLGLDPLYGAARRYLRPFLEAQGLKPLAIHEERDVLFAGRAPDPSSENLEELRRLVLSKKLDLGLATDGDADRFGVIDAEGEWIAPNEVLGLVLDHLVRHRGMKGKVVRSVMTSHFVDAVAKSHGLEVRETPVGFKYIGNLLRSGQYLLGGEESGGLSIMGHVPEKDGMLACLLLAELVAAERKPLHKIRQELKKRVGWFQNVRINFRTQGLEQIRRIQDQLSLRPPLELAGGAVRRIDQTDGFKFILRDGSWVGFRISGTEPVVRLYVEAQDDKRLQKLIDAGKGLLKGA